MEQLLAHLDRLPPYDQHLVQIMSVMGLRSVDALHLAEDCLEYDAAGDPRVRWYNVKMKREVRPLLVSREVEAAILAQRELVAAAAATRNTCHVRCRLSAAQVSKTFLYDPRQADLAAEIRRLRDLPSSHRKDTRATPGAGKSEAAKDAQIARLQEWVRMLEHEANRLREENAVLYGRLAERS